MPLRGFRQKIAKSLLPLPVPKTMDSNETALGRMSLSVPASLSALEVIALPDVTAPWNVDSFTRQLSVVAPPVNFGDLPIIGAGISDELQFLRSKRQDIALLFDASSDLPPPALTSLSGSLDLTEPPEVVEFFDALLPPQVLGSAYTSVFRNAAKSTGTGGAEGLNLRGAGRCRHGLRLACGICQSIPEPQSRLRGKPCDHGPDIFQQLRFILQPPLLPRLAVPGVFPDNRRPYPFQIDGIRWLLEHSEGLLADEMGLGKTMQAILAMRVLFQRGQLRQALVVAPASVAATWEREFIAWAPELTAIRVQGSQGERDSQWRTPAEIHTVSYESLRSDVQRAAPVNNIPFSLCIADEAQKIKNPASATSRAVRDISANCRFRWALTGTPLENAASDAVSIFGFIAPALRLETQSQNPQSLRRAITSYSLRRTKKQVDLQFPELRHDMHWLELNPGQRKAYQTAENAGVDQLRKLGSNATRVHIFALITELKLICNYDQKSRQSCKLDFLQDSLDEITDNGEKALIFSQYPNMTLSKIADDLERFRPLRFDGSVNPRQRERIIDQFQERDENDILLMGIRSGGMGITLTRANHVFHFDHWWNPAIVDQGSARVHRIGQQRAVFIHSLYTRDTIEERVDAILSRKRQLFQDVFGELEDNKVAEKLSDEELFGLFGLNAPRTASRR